ncbi:hypothetical protein AB833_24500 [Chromatiales bacterium (ex Bugula neritina AB1)]|nr:hypothetical protein AB833_24500 [Chromatiales bacterium (ex Bugula neritina AB1)]
MIAPPRELQEARNAIKVYDQFDDWSATEEQHLLSAHRLLMSALVDDAGLYRCGNVGVMNNDKVVYMAPPANQVHRLMSNLFAWLKSTNQHPLIVRAVFHYEFEFIHPFSDGNGRMGRLWQSLILSQWRPLLAQLPVESMVHARKIEYYQALNASTRQSDSAPFIEFMLAAILALINDYAGVDTPQVTPPRYPPGHPPGCEPPVSVECRSGAA